mmetsp:Transcript_6825/g.18904  ORF Transcript_6825/g.18904 Transcript_6825/m.18904 type:complete len:109 (-) Transcript_6825:344-670(-)
MKSVPGTERCAKQRPDTKQIERNSSCGLRITQRQNKTSVSPHSFGVGCTHSLTSNLEVPCASALSSSARHVQGCQEILVVPCAVSEQCRDLRPRFQKKVINCLIQPEP